jgi:hypothetical protein
MIDVLKLVARSLGSLFKSRGRLEAEIMVLRHQLMILRRKTPPRLRLGVVDRLIFVWLYRLHPSVIRAVTIVRPETVVRWHRWISDILHVLKSAMPRDELLALVLGDNINVAMMWLAGYLSAIGVIAATLVYSLL